MSAEAYDRRSRIGISKGVNQMRIPSQSKPVTRGVSTSRRRTVLDLRASCAIFACWHATN
jgi:hypothetical protein